MNAYLQRNKIVEPISDGVSRVWDVKNHIFSERTQFQEVQIVETSHGITLFCNNERQSSELSQLAYHEGQVLPALLTMKILPKTALVIGSSEGVVTQILEVQKLEKIVHIDIDEKCMDACSEYLPYGYTPCEASRLKSGTATTRIIIGDGINHIKHANKAGYKYDLIISDVPDDTNDEQEIYSQDFWSLIKSCLSENGAFITQAGNPCLWRNASLINSWKKMHAIFDNVTYFGVEEQDWVWLVGHNSEQLTNREHIAKRLEDLLYKPKFIDMDVILKSVIPPMSLRMQE